LSLYIANKSRHIIDKYRDKHHKSGNNTTKSPELINKSGYIGDKSCACIANARIITAKSGKKTIPAPDNVDAAGNIIAQSRDNINKSRAGINMYKYIATLIMQKKHDKHAPSVFNGG